MTGSSAACYGTPDVDVVTEATPVLPESPYGETKLIGEWLLHDVARVSDLRHTCLRSKIKVDHNDGRSPRNGAATDPQRHFCRRCGFCRAPSRP